jgi:hypothetical protein
MATQNKRFTKFPNGVETFVVDSNCTVKDSAYTVVANTDSGKTFITFTDNMVFTLPAIALGETYTFINGAEDGAAKLSISPNAADGIMYLNSATDNKDLINTKATAKKGDFVTLSAVYTGATLDYWTVTNIRGVWAKEA